MMSVIIQRAEVWARDMVEVEFSGSVAVNAALRSPGSFSVVPDGSSTSIEIDDVLVPREDAATLRVFLIVAGMEDGRRYTVTANGLRAADGTSPGAIAGRFVARPTITDNILQNYNPIYALGPREPLRQILSAIGRQIDLLAGSRRDLLP